MNPGTRQALTILWAAINQLIGFAICYFFVFRTYKKGIEKAINEIR